jgi:flagellar biosynthesis component FlhA
MKIAKNAEDDINWVLGLNDRKKSEEVNTLRENASLIYQMGQNMSMLGDAATGKELQDKANALIQKIQAQVGNIMQ